MNGNRRIIDDMTDEPMGRRTMLRRVGLGAGTAALATAGVAHTARGESPVPETLDTDDQLLGAWMIDREDNSSPTTLRGIFSFTAGGVVVYHDIAPIDNRISTGAWAANGDGTFRATFWAGFDADPAAGTPSVTGQAHASITLEAGVISGTYNVSVFDAATEAHLVDVTGTFSGSRIEA